MRAKNIAMLFLGVVLVAAGSSLARAAEILMPPPQTAVNTDFISISARTDGPEPVPWQLLRSSGSLEQGEAAPNANNTVEFTVNLSPGLNQVRVGETMLQVFYADGSQKPPPGFFLRKAHADDISQCDDCHETVTGQLLDGGYPGVCLNCHVVVSQNPKNDTDPLNDKHFRAAISNCGTCHDVHFSQDRKLIAKARQQPCSGCHTRHYDGNEGHPAYEEGECFACHDAHYSGYRKNLHQNMPEICHECHDQASEVEQKAFHPPSGRDGQYCSVCHNPHGTRSPLLTDNFASAEGLCKSCHAPILEHGHQDELEECLLCHNPHKAVKTGLLRRDFPAGCEECHDGMREGKTVHPPVEDGCDSCHNPHRDDNVEVATGMCFTCHDFESDQEIAAIHGYLTMSVEQCLGCHPVHTSKQDMLVHAKTHFPLTQAKCDACHGAGEEASLAIADVVPRCAKCHSTVSDLEKAKFRIHDPVVDDGCPQCHNPHMSRQGGYLNAPMQEVCAECHDVAETDDGKTLHEAAETCTDCHGPHGGQYAKFLRNEPPALCIECHDDPAEEGEVHPALDEGCTSCHDPHSGYAGALMHSEEVATVCFECHDDPAEGKKNVHPALDEGCTSCHNPHASKNSSLLLESDDNVCFECHDNPEDEDGEVHPALDEGCTACHDPHAADNGKLLVGNEEAVCFECHDDPTEGKANIHPALDEGCTACHNPHLSVAGPLLSNPVNQVCADCHEASDHEHPLDADYADEHPSGKFPKSGEQMACIGCHNPHASNEASLYGSPEDTLCNSCH